MSAESPRNAAQLSQIQAHYERQVQQIVTALNLRKWLVEQIAENLTASVFSGDEFLDLAKKLHAFIVEPANELKPPPGA